MKETQLRLIQEQESIFQEYNCNSRLDRQVYVDYTHIPVYFIGRYLSFFVNVI